MTWSASSAGVSKLLEAARFAMPEHAVVAVPGEPPRTEVLGRVFVAFEPRDVEGGADSLGSANAIIELERRRTRGAEFLALPTPTNAWMEDLRLFGDHCRSRYKVVFESTDLGAVVDLRAHAAPASRSDAETHDDSHSLDGAAAALSQRSYNEPHEWVKELDEVQVLVGQGDYDAADAALDAFEQRWPAASGWAAYTRAIVCMHSRSAEDTLAAIACALDDETLGQEGRVHLSELLIQHHGEVGNTQALRLAMHQMLSNGVTNSGVLEQITHYAEMHNLTDVLARLRNGLTGEVPPRGISWFGGLPRAGTTADDSFVESIPVFECVEVILVHRDHGLYVFDTEANLVRDCATSTTAEALDAARLLARTRPALSVEGSAVLIQDRFLKPNYCHWLLDWLPRLEIARVCTPAADVVIGHGLTEAFQTDSLEFVRVRRGRFIATAANPLLRVERLVVPDTCFRVRHPASNGNPALLKWWRELVMDRVGPIEPRGERLYLPRTETRQIREERKLRMLLERYGFRALEPGALPFRDQIEAFRGASAIVGPHGAALTNILFAPSECRVLELLASRGGTKAYQILAAALGQNYTALRDRGRAPSFAGRHNNLSITADLDAVEAWLTGLG